jgi:hypothetical protein
MFKDSHVVSFNFLFDLEGVNVTRPAFNITQTDSINEAGLADTISTDETVSGAHRQLESSVFHQVVASHDNVDGQVDVLVKVVTFLVAHFG